MTIRELLEKRARTVADMRALTDAPAGDGGDLSADQASKFDGLKTELEGLEARIARQQTLDDAERRMAGQQIAGSGDGHLDAELREFSLTRAIAGAAGIAVDCGREREVSAELARRSGRPFQGIAVPMEVFEQRVTTAGGSGGNLVATDHMGNQFIDILRARLITGRLGARVLTGLHGNVDIPRRTGSVTSGWVAENAALSAADATFDQVSLTPKHAGAITELSRNMLQQASPDVEQITRADLAAVLAQAIDAAALAGSGTGAVPEGVLNVTGIGSVTLSGTPTWAEVLSFIDDVESADSMGTGFALHPKARTVFRATVKEAGQAVYLMETQNSMAGLPVQATTTLPVNLGVGTNETPIIFGNWADLLVGYWSVLDVLVNPFETTAYSKGNVQVRAMLTADVAVRHAESFTAGNLVLA